MVFPAIPIIGGFLIRLITPRFIQFLALGGLSTVLVDKVAPLLSPTVAMTDLTKAETDQIKSIAATNLPDDTKAKLIAELLNNRGTDWTTVGLYVTIVIIVILMAYLILKRGK